MNEPVRFAIVGCGVIAQTHAEGIMNTAEATLVAVFDENEEKGQRFAEQYGADFYASYEQLLALDHIEVINICTPSGLHAEQTIMAARSGKHIICEKPLAIHTEDVGQMITVCHEEGVKLSTVFPRRVGPAAVFLKQFIAEGGLGKITLADAIMKIYRSQDYYDSAGWRGTWEMDGGGAMMNQGIHLVDMLQWLVGPVESVYGKAAALQRNIDVEDTVVSLLQFQNGGLGVIEMTTTVHPDLGQRIEIHGEKGTAILTEDDITLLQVDGQDIQLPRFEPFKVLPDGHRYQIRDMALAVREDRSPSITGEDGVHALEIILGTYESSRKGESIKLNTKKVGEQV
ncbi:MAG TPA: Gfo/Idh/MocA family oxidoreductase [Candidatus Paenibacillus intestinavium]|nr:Gfo/Idh/MocA family oxidoreductase [Candidatus Paenibacillus intestinavium]